MHSALTVGQIAAMAGRSMPAMGRRISFDIAMKAPVLPAETATSASPFCTASMASHRLVPLPRRKAWLGLSLMPTVVSVWTTRDLAASAGAFASSAAIARSVAEEQEAERGIALAAKWPLPPPRRAGRDPRPWRRALSSAAETCRGSPRSYCLGLAAAHVPCGHRWISPGPYSFAVAKQHDFHCFSLRRVPRATVRRSARRHG